MICPGCNTKNVEHAYARTDNPPCASWPRCSRCGDVAEPSNGYRQSRITDLMTEHRICFGCAHGEEQAENYAAGRTPGLLIIGGAIYSADKRQCVPLGNADPSPTARWRGMAGRRFDIERLDGSAPFSCYSLWYGRTVDPAMRDRMPDNARFLHGAERTQAGDITCFNPSRERAK